MRGDKFNVVPTPLKSETLYGHGTINFGLSRRDTVFVIGWFIQEWQVGVSAISNTEEWVRDVITGHLRGYGMSVIKDYANGEGRDVNPFASNMAELAIKTVYPDWK